MKNFTEQGHSLTAAAEREFVRDVKKKLCHIASDFVTEKTYELSCGNTITVGAERVRFAEVLFRPKLTDNGASGIHGFSLSDEVRR